MSLVKRLELSIENAACKKLRKLGCLTRKMNGRGFRSWPDRLVLAPDGCEYFIEFKRPGEKVTKLQAAMHRNLRALGYLVYVCDSVDSTIDANESAFGILRMGYSAAHRAAK